MEVLNTNWSFFIEIDSEYPHSSFSIFSNCSCSNIAGLGFLQISKRYERVYRTMLRMTTWTIIIYVLTTNTFMRKIEARSGEFYISIGQGNFNILILNENGPIHREI